MNMNTENKMHARNAYVREGFSLIEMLIVFAVMAIAAAIIVPNMMSYLGGAKIKKAKADVRAINLDISRYYMDTNQYPSTLKDLITRPADERVSKKWMGPYLSKKDVPRDPWGAKYVYQVTPENAAHPYELYSHGPNGKKSPKAEWISVWDEE
jgi:general secretion pathway protein G